MAISLLCPGCERKLSAPPNAAGKKVQCPNCKKLLTVPGSEDFEVVEDDFEVVDDDFEVVEDDAPPRKAKKRPTDDDYRPRPKKKRPVLDDHDLDDEDDRPRKKKGKKKPPPKSNLPLYIGLGVAAALLLAAGLYFGLKGDKKASAAGDGAGWVKYSPPDGSYSILMPHNPTRADIAEIANLIGASPEDVAEAKRGRAARNMDPECYLAIENKRRFFVSMMKIPGLDQAALEPMLGTISELQNQEYAKYGTITGEETHSVAGQSTKWIVVKCNNGKTLLSSFFAANERLFVLTVIDEDPLSSSDASFKKFIESFAPNAQPAAGTGGGPGPPRRGRR